MTNANAIMYEYPLDANACDLVWKLSFSHPFVGIARDTLIKYLLSDDIVFKLDNVILTPTKSFAFNVKKYWKPFCNDAVETILNIGILPVAVMKIDGRRVPYVPKWGKYRIKTYTKGGVQKFKFYWLLDPSDPVPKKKRNNMTTFAERYDPEVQIMHRFGSDPSVFGKLSSKMNRLLSNERFVNILRDCATIAEPIACNPPIITQTLPDPRKEVEHYDIYNDIDPREATERDKIRRGREAAELLERAKAAAYNLSVAAATTTECYDVKPTLSTRDDCRTAMPWDNTYPIPITQQHVDHRLPTPRKDLVDLLRIYQEEVCAVFGIPRSTIIRDGVVRGNEQAIREAFHKTIDEWKDILGSVLTEAYSMTYYALDVKYIAYHMSKEGVEDDVVYGGVADGLAVTVELPLSVTVAPEKLTEAYQLGVLDPKVYAPSFLQSIGMSPESVNPKFPLEVVPLTAGTTKTGKREIDPYDSDDQLDKKPKKKKKEKAAQEAQ